MNDKATSLIQQALAAINNEVKSVGKDSVNKMQGFNYRGIDAVMNNLHPIFAKHQVLILPEVVAERSEERTSKNGGVLIYRILTVRYTFMAVDGSSVSTIIVAEGMDSGDKAANKALAIALKNTLTQMFLLPYDEVDPDAESHEVISKPQDPIARPVAPPKGRETKQPTTTAERPSQTPPVPPSTPAETKKEYDACTGILATFRVKEGTNKNNKPYTMTTVELEDGKKFSSFDKKLPEKCEALKGDEVRIEWEPNGKYRNLISIEPIDETKGDANEDDIPMAYDGDDEQKF